MRRYESMVIIDTKIDENERLKTINKIKEFIEKSGGKIISFEEWGNRKLAYPIKKRNEGYYILLKFESDNKLPLALRDFYRLEENILRSIIVREDE